MGLLFMLGGYCTAAEELDADGGEAVWRCMPVPLLDVLALPAVMGLPAGTDEGVADYLSHMVS